MEENNGKEDAARDRTRHLELKKRLIKSLEDLKSLSSLDPSDIENLIRQAEAEENPVLTYHKLKILHEIFESELKGGTS